MAQIIPSLDLRNRWTAGLSSASVSHPSKDSQLPLTKEVDGLSISGPFPEGAVSTPVMSVTQAYTVKGLGAGRRGQGPGTDAVL